MLKADLVAALPTENLPKIVDRAERVAFKTGDVVVQQGDRIEYFYMIDDCRCETSRTISAGRGHIHLAELAPGECFGARALICDEPSKIRVTALCDGNILRLRKLDFDQLILDPLLAPLELDQALEAIAAGAMWLDIRSHVKPSSPTLERGIHIPLDELAERRASLDRHTPYIVFSDDLTACAAAVFLLAEQGLKVRHLNEPIGAALYFAQRSAPQATNDNATIINLIQKPDAANAEEIAAMDQTQRPNPLDDTIAHIDRLYTHEDAQAEANEKVPSETYADTATGQSLAAVIDALEGDRDNLDDMTDSIEILDIGLDKEFAVNELSAVEDDDIAPAGNIEASMAALFGDIEGRMRETIDSIVSERTAHVEAAYRDKLLKMRDLTNQEITQREAAIRVQVANEFRDKEQALRNYYKKVIALANSIARQKAQLQEARKQFERKLTTANQLYREVEEMRQLLTDQIHYMDEQQIAEIPQLSVSL